MFSLTPLATSPAAAGPGSKRCAPGAVSLLSARKSGQKQTREAHHGERLSEVALNNLAKAIHISSFSSVRMSGRSHPRILSTPAARFCRILLQLIPQAEATVRFFRLQLPDLAESSYACGNLYEADGSELSATCRNSTS